MIEFDNSAPTKRVMRSKAMECKLIDFVVSSGREFVIQMFGIDSDRKTYSITIKNYKPFFYIQIPDSWNENMIIEYMGSIKKYVNKELNPSKNPEYDVKIEYKKVMHHKLYGFDGYKEHSFIQVICQNLAPINVIKGLFYDKKTQQLFPNGYLFQKQSTYIYEVQIPPLLRYFHIQCISPSGWVEIKNFMQAKTRKTRCDYELYSSYSNIIALNDKEDIVPYKICSFDIEASSSHGDFPLAKKGYSKVAYEIFNYFDSKKVEHDKYQSVLYELLLTVFNFSVDYDIDNVYLKNPKIMTRSKFEECFEKLIAEDISKVVSNDDSIVDYLSLIDKKCNSSEDNVMDVGSEENIIIEDESHTYHHNNKSKITKKKKTSCNIISYLQDSNIEKVEKVTKLAELMQTIYPGIEGDKVTFIGSTFMNFQDSEPYLNHCVVLDECAEPQSENTVYVSCKTEKELLMAWRDLILEEDPDIIIGYNIFGFDYSFMYERAQENSCHHDFCQISRNNYTNSKLKESSIVIASGQHDLKYIEMPGRLQIDMYNYFRRDFNLSSYKLDNVAAEFLSDKISTIEYDESCNLSRIYTKNMKGLEVDGLDGASQSIS